MHGHIFTTIKSHDYILVAQ